MKPPEFDYVAPSSVREAVSLLGQIPDAKVLAGGQSLLPLLNFRLAAPMALIDIARIGGLDQIECHNGSLHIGAMVRQRRAEESPLVRRHAPLVWQALRCVAHPQIRSRGTVGGSIAHADPAAELPATLLALDSRVRVTGAGGERIVEARNLFKTFFTTSLASDEIITAIELPIAQARSGAACIEVARRAGDYALCGAVAQVTLAEEDVISDVRVALFGVAPRPQRAALVEQSLSGLACGPQALAASAEHASEGLEPPDDAQASAPYRRHLARVLTRRALEQAVERACTKDGV